MLLFNCCSISTLSIWLCAFIQLLFFNYTFVWADVYKFPSIAKPCSLAAILKATFSMTEIQFDLAILGLIILLNVIITFVYKKYSHLKEQEDKMVDFGNYSGTVSNFPGSFMPRVPFLIIRRTKSKQLKKTIIIHNILCVVVYALFATAIFYNFR